MKQEQLPSASSSSTPGASGRVAGPALDVAEVLPSLDEATDPAGVPELHEVDCPPELAERIGRYRDRYPDPRSASIPALWEVQRHYGWCSPEGIRQAAAVLGFTPGFLESVASFYDMLKLAPVGRHTVMVCTNISCWLRGGDELMAAFCDAAGTPSSGGTSSDGAVEIEHFECLGACDIAPMASIDHRYFGPLTPELARTAVEQLRSDEEVLPALRLLDRPAAGGSHVPDDPRVSGSGTAAAGSSQEADTGATPDDEAPDGGPSAGGPHSEEGSGGRG